jgi:hypothetical protein
MGDARRVPHFTVCNSTLFRFDYLPVPTRTRSMRFDLLGTL